MRAFLNAILAFISSESLTDDEFEGLEAISPPLTQSYNRANYLALRTVLEARENVSDQVERLKTYFMARGVNVSDTPAVPTPNSNIFIGSAL